MFEITEEQKQAAEYFYLQSVKPSDLNSLDRIQKLYIAYTYGYVDHLRFDLDVQTMVQLAILHPDRVSKIMACCTTAQQQQEITKQAVTNQPCIAEYLAYSFPFLMYDFLKNNTQKTNQTNPNKVTFLLSENGKTFTLDKKAFLTMTQHIKTHTEPKFQHKNAELFHHREQ